MLEKQDPEAEGRRARVGHHVVKWVIILIVLALVLGLVVQLLWNWLMPEIFSVKRITLVQGIGLMLLCRVLIGGMGKRREHSGYLTGKYGFRGLAWFGGKEEAGTGEKAGG